MIRMLKSTPIIVVDDDEDDHIMLRQIFDDLTIQSEVKMFSTTSGALKYLRTTSDSPFIIFCDINLPETGGLEFKTEIDNDPLLRKKSIPFVFYTTTVRQKDIDIAYSSLTIQGFFEKPHNFQQAKNLIKLVMEYWYHCKHPNSFAQQNTIK